LTGFLRAYRWELFKLYRRPAVWVTVAILLALAIGLGYVLTWYIFTYPPKGAVTNLPRGETLASQKVVLYAAGLVRHTLGQWSTLGGVFALILGVLSQGSEYGWGTVKTLFTQGPGRLAMLAGKLSALLLLILVMVLALFAVDAISSVAVMALDGKSSDWPAATDLVKGVAAGWLIFSFWAIFGFTLASVFQQSAMAIGLGLAYAVLVEGIILGILGAVGGDLIKQIEVWFPLANASYLVASFGSNAGLRAAGQAATAPPADANHAVAVLLVYLVVLVGVSGYLVRRRDVV
jgi:ABC-2 type transport system permease protein